MIVWVAAGVGASSVVTQLTLMREMLGAFAGNEMVLGTVLGNWLLLTGLGAFLGRPARRRGEAIAPLIAAQILLAFLPLAQVFLVRALRDRVFTRGEMIGPAQTVLSSLVVLPPYCLLSGCLLTLGCAALATGLRYVYVGNVPGLAVVEDAFCPQCKKAVMKRQVFSVTEMNLQGGRCRYCQSPVAGVWS